MVVLSVIYITRKVPAAPTFNGKEFVGKHSLIPLMMIQSPHDEFVPIEGGRRLAWRPGRHQPCDEKS